MKITIVPNFAKDKRPKSLLEGRWSLGLNYQITKEIGHGSYGRVFEAIDTKTHSKIAIKKFIRALGHPQLAQYCLRELEIMSKLDHPNIVKLHKVMHSTQSVYLVMDHMPFDLKKLIYSATFLDHDQVRLLMYEIIIAVNYLHSTKVVHRDIKPGNILASPDCSIKLCDFGLARSICGLKITEYDFDEIYRREFAESNDKDLVTDVLGMHDVEEKMEDLDEHAEVNNKISMPGHFDVNMKKDKGLAVDSDIPSEMPEFEHRLIKPDLGTRIASCGLVPDVKFKNVEEDKASNTALPEKAKARRQEFIKNLKPDPLLEREMTSHIASRWYRAPEVILLEKVYCGPVDLWGVGCVFGELLQMIKANKPDPQARKPLFPGTSCFPLSPQLKPGSDGEIEYFQSGEQIIMICNVLGTPSEADTSFITDHGAKQYVKLLPKSPGIKFKTLYPDCTDDELDLLSKLLTFNPFTRITAKEALRHPYFKSIRCKEKEVEGAPLALSNKAPDNVSIQNLKNFCDTISEENTKVLKTEDI